MRVARLIVGVLCPPRHTLGRCPASTRSRWRAGKREPRLSELLELAADAAVYEPGSFGGAAELTAAELGLYFRPMINEARWEGGPRRELVALHRLALACVYAAHALGDEYASAQLGVRDNRQVDLEELIASADKSR